MKKLVISQYQTKVLLKDTFHWTLKLNQLIRALQKHVVSNSFYFHRFYRKAIQSNGRSRTLQNGPINQPLNDRNYTAVCVCVSLYSNGRDLWAPLSSDMGSIKNSHTPTNKCLLIQKWTVWSPGKSQMQTDRPHHHHYHLVCCVRITSKICCNHRVSKDKFGAHNTWLNK